MVDMPYAFFDKNTKLSLLKIKEYIQGCHFLEKSWIFFPVLESPWILFISPWKYLEGFPVIYQDRMWILFIQ